MNTITSQNLSHIYEGQSTNTFKTYVYLTLFIVLVSTLGYFLAVYFKTPVFFYGGFFVSIGMSLWSYWFSDKMVLKMAGAVEITEEENGDSFSHGKLFARVRELSARAGLPMPKVYKINDPAPNAFATGRNKNHAAVAFTTGILALLSEEELDGVIAHELSHIANRDILLMTVVGVLASFISLVANYMMFMSPSQSSEEGNSNNTIVAVAAMIVITLLLPLAATLVQMAISRKREFLADAGGSIITQDPEGLALALQKIAGFPVGMKNVNPSISHLFISNPEKLDTGEVPRRTPWYAGLFMTHPPVEERVRSLRGE